MDIPRIYHGYTSNDILCISMDIPRISLVDIRGISMDIPCISRCSSACRDKLPLLNRFYAQRDPNAHLSTDQTSLSGKDLKKKAGSQMIEMDTRSILPISPRTNVSFRDPSIASKLLSVAHLSNTSRFSKVY
jgi:hypothetical protein